ncbi:PilZ domain-containing protein [Sphingomonas baiyangensis]|uniref:PilZ domain-containing protein n=1 Tax=Sphingomonas baiyangensis TaxID=2572576 RepID=A0A4U1L1E0_9SPHN|nr:PilZ domain-containing protein [Sphingomonas baiyangensis]TKD50294.1 PilZ domain-containing protein [Sphingomonas baiyangensis]
MDRYAHDPVPPGDDDAGTQRNAARDSLLLTATLRIGDAETTVRIRNLSAGGLMAEYGRSLPLDTAVDVDIRGIGWTAGKVVWAVDGRLGIAFDAPIDPLLARKPVGSGKQTPVYLKPPLSRR